jgi:toxin ParE1/3/4
MAHVLAPEAKSDLDDIWCYVANESGQVEVADRLIDAITSRFQLLAAHPHIGRKRDDLRSGLRSFPVDDYVILYRVQGEAVLILHVLHGRRDIGGFVQRGH